MRDIKIRLMELSDSKRIHEILINPKFSLFSPEPKSIEETIFWINKSSKSAESGTGYHYIIKLNEEIIGGISVKIFSHRRHIGEIAYFIDEPYWGQGIVVEAIKLLEQKCFNDLGLTRLEAVMELKNINSEKVAIKSGYQKEGLLKKVIIDKEGNLKDVYLYAKTL